jgi:hypothetical protein
MRALAQTPSCRLAAVLASVVDGGPSAALSTDDAAWLVDAAMRVDAGGAEAWAAVTAVCATGDVVTTAMRLLSSSVLSVAAVATLTTASSDDDAAVHAASMCLEAVASVCGAALSRDAVDATSAMVCGGGLDALLSTMRRHRDAASVQQHGCAILRTLVRGCGGMVAAAAIGAADGVDVVLSAMQRLVDVLAVQECCCRVLYSIARIDATALASRACSVIDGVVLAMTTHRDSREVHECGCAVLECVVLAAVVVGVDVSDAVTCAVVSAGDAVMLAMQHHPDVAAVQSSGCAIAATYCRSCPATLPTTERVLSAMRRHADDIEVQGRGCGALSELVELLSIEDTARLAPLTKTGSIIDVLLQALRRHAPSAIVQEHACAALACLACRSCLLMTSEPVMARCCVDAALSAMQTHADSDGVQLQCLRLLHAIGRDADGAAAIGGASADCIAATLASMRRHGGIEAIQRHCCKMLRKLACHSAANVVSIAAAGGVHASSQPCDSCAILQPCRRLPAVR